MTCFFPTGAEAPDDQACNATAPVSHCCAKGSVCLSNGYCLTAGQSIPYVLSRGTCTDDTFQSLSCPQRCKDVGSYTGAVLVSVTPGENEYCCNGGENNGTCFVPSLGQSNPFTIPEGNVIYNRSDGSTQLPSISVAQPTSIPSPAIVSPSIIYRTDTSHGTAIGAGVGVPLGVLLIVAVAAWFIQLRHAKSLRKRLKISRRM